MIRRLGPGAAPAASAPARYGPHGDAAAQWQGAGGGGIANGIYLSSAELYDPATGTLEQHRQPRHRTRLSHGDAAAQWQGAGGGRIQW